jgi:hypothetical protein
LLSKLLELALRLVESVLLNEHSLGEDVERIGIAPERLLQHLFCVEVFFLELGLIDALNQALEHLLFLWCHGRSFGTKMLVLPHIGRWRYGKGRRRVPFLCGRLFGDSRVDPFGSDGITVSGEMQRFNVLRERAMPPRKTM